jgi:hypothetical protein
VRRRLWGFAPLPPLRRRRRRLTLDGRAGRGCPDCEPRSTADWETELFRIYNPSTLSQIGSFAAGFDLNPFIVGSISFTGTGQTMVYQDGDGLHVYEGVPVPEPATIGILVTFMAGGVLRRKRRLARTGRKRTA